MAFFLGWLIKLTSWIPQRLIFRIKVHYEDRSAQSTRVRGKAIIASNHRSVWDFGIMMFVFFGRTLRCVVAEVLYAKNIFLKLFLICLGTIKVDRDSHEFAFLGRCKRVLDRGGVVEIYPESRLPRAGEQMPLEFKPSTVYLALESGAPIIPVYHNGKHFSRERMRVIIGKPIFARELYDTDLSEKENIQNITNYLRGRIIELGKELERQESEEARHD